MKKNEIKLGGIYEARISGRYVKVRVDKIYTLEATSYRKEATHYTVTNLSTNRRTTFRSAAKFRGEAKPIPSALKETDGYQMLNDADKKTYEDEQRADPTATNAESNLTEIASGKIAALVATNLAPVAMTAGPVGSLAAKIATANSSAPVASGLTEQQKAILAVGQELEAQQSGQRVLVIGAGAGTGKTFTLKQLESVLRGNGQYTAFNSSLVAESKEKFKKAACNTTHSLAFRAVGKRFAHRLNGARVKSYQIAHTLGIEDFYVELPESIAPLEDGKPQVRRLKAAWLAGQVTQAIRKFCQSADRELSVKHFARIDGIDEKDSYTNSDKVKQYLLGFAIKAWSDLSSETGMLPFSHDVYVKLWQLGDGPNRPVIAADYILLDEAQDTAPVMLDILQQQRHALLILVGDDNQQIYEWRGAVNAMSAFAGAPRKLLSQSFRFGQTVADVANSILAGLEVPTDLVMSGLESIPTRICKVENPRCFLYRTNAGAIGRLMSEMELGRRGHLIGGTKDVVTFCKAAIDLQQGRGTTHPELGCFTNWTEVQEYSKEDEGQDLRLMVKLIDTFTAEAIVKALENMPAEKDADLILSTAHRSKGREWPSVKLGADFPTADKLTDADRRLLYVAATRAQEELDITECPTFCGGMSGKGEDGDGGRWIPGIEIEYTCEMPSPESLEEYRAKKAARKAEAAPATPAPTAAPFVAPAPILPQGNGSGHLVRNGGEDFTWANMEGQWTVRGKASMTGQRVTVVRKNGSKSQETLRGVVRKMADVWFYSVR